MCLSAPGFILQFHFPLVSAMNTIWRRLQIFGGFSIRLVLANMAETRWKRQSGTLRSQHISPKPVEMQFVKLICNAPACPIAGLSERSEHDRKGNICLPTDRPHHSRMNWTPRVSQSRNQSFMAAVSGYEAWLQNGTWDLGHWEPDNVTSTIVKGRPTLFFFLGGGLLCNSKSKIPTLPQRLL